jgi:hypothetical protein
MSEARERDFWLARELGRVESVLLPGSSKSAVHGVL